MSQASTVLQEEFSTVDISAPLGRLHAGEPFVELLDNDSPTRAAALETLLADLADGETRLVWIGNPLRSPLTLERLFLQAAGPEADLRTERSPAELVAMLRAAFDGAAHCLLIVQQPETLDPEARDTLAHLAPLLDQPGQRIQFLFCGTTAFRAIPLAPCGTAAAAMHDESAPTSGSRRAVREKLPLLLLLIVATAGAWPTVTQPPVRVTALAPAEAVMPAANAAPLPPAPTPAPAPASDDITTLRSEFDAFLALQPRRAARLSPEQRDALFKEFLAREQQRQTQPTP